MNATTATPGAASIGLWPRLFECLYRAVLRAYPAPFRRETGAELLGGFRQVIRSTKDPRNGRSIAASAFRELLDLLRNLPREWRNPSGSGPGPRTGQTATVGARWRAIFDDARHAARSLRRQPRFTISVVLILGVGLGATTAVYSVVEAVLLEPLPYPDAEQLFYLTETFRETQGKSVSYPNYVDWRSGSTTFSDMGGRLWWSFNLTGQGEARELEAMLVTPNLFEVLGLAPEFGRGLVEDEVDSIVVSHGLAIALFAQPADALGEVLDLDGLPFAVVGVMPKEIEFPLNGSDVYAPIELLGEDMARRSSHPGMSVIGRVRPELDVVAARADLDSLARRLAVEYPDSNSEAGIRVVGLKDRLVQADGGALWILLAAVALVLLGVCANLGNLMSVRATRRGAELAIRAAMGAGRARLVRQMLIEAAMLVGAGATAGVFVAAAAVSLVRSRPDLGLPRAGSVDVDASVVLFAVLLAVTVGLLFAALPALRAAAIRPGRALGNGAQRVTGRKSWGRSFLVVTEVALALVLLVGAGLMLRTTNNLLRADIGMRLDGVLSAYLGPPQTEYPENADRVRLYRQLIDAVADRPGVAAVGGIDPLPLSGYNRQRAISGDGFDSVDDNGLRTDVASVTPGYFATMGIPLFAGRTFTEDDREASPSAVVDEALAERLWPGENAVGRRFRFRGNDSDWMTVIGVVGSVKPYGVTEESRVQLYLPYTTVVFGLSILARVDGDPRTALPFLREALQRLDPNLPLTRIATMRALFDETNAAQNLVARLLTAFALAALALALFGLYAVLSYSVAQRRREFGIHIALGAGRARLLAEAAGQGLRLTAVGVALGVVVALAAGRVLASLLFGVAAFDPLTVGTSVALTLALASTAIAVPALRATRVDPREALQGD